MTGWSVAAYSDAAVGQDAHAVHVGDCGVWAVLADGAGGRPDGAVAARIAVDTAIGYLISVGYRVEDAYVASRVAEQALRAAMRADRVHPDAATTLTIAGATPTGSCLVTRGDSPVWRVGTGGLAAWGDRDAVFLTGAEPGEAAGSVGPPLHDGELLVVATDGVLEGIPEVLPGADDPVWTPAGLVAAARAGGGVDDITVVTIARVPAPVQSAGARRRVGALRGALGPCPP